MPLDDPVFVKAVLKTLVLPPTGLLLLAAAGLLLLRARPRLGHALAWFGVGGLLLLSIPVVALVLHRALDATPPFDAARARDAGALVILGSGMRRGAPEYGGDTLGLYTLERVRYGARLARSTGLPVLVAGGALHGRSAEASVMKDVLERELGVTVRWTEARSRDTHENALRTAEILLPAGVHEVVLVAHSIDMPRARAEFEAAGLRVLPAPIGLPVRQFDSLLDWLPGIASLVESSRVAYEAAGEVVRVIRR
jgi:uncharacterized SAM-binding protein YcdF (DUF218 family)